MFKIDPAELRVALSQLREIKVELNAEVTDIYRGFVAVAYDSVLEETPQWTGHAAAQWNIGIEHIDMSTSNLYAEENLAVSKHIRAGVPMDDDSGDFLSSAKAAGDPAAIEEAKHRQGSNLEEILLTDVIYISNNVENMLNEAYASKLEENPNNYLREVNEPGHMIARTVEWFNSRLAVIDMASRARLRVARLSDSGIMESF